MVLVTVAHQRKRISSYQCLDALRRDSCAGRVETAGTTPRIVAGRGATGIVGVVVVLIHVAGVVDATHVDHETGRGRGGVAEARCVSM